MDCRANKLLLVILNEISENDIWKSKSNHQIVVAIYGLYSITHCLFFYLMMLLFDSFYLRASVQQSNEIYQSNCTYVCFEIGDEITLFICELHFIQGLLFSHLYNAHSIVLSNYRFSP